MNPQDLLSKLLSNPGASAAAGGFLGGSLSGLLTSKKGRKSAKKLATYGGLAAVGVMAYQAWQRSRGEAPAAPPSQVPSAPGAQAAGAAVGPPPPPALSDVEADAAADARFLPAPEDTGAAESLANHLLQAMISAARADGTLDADEQERIQSQLARAELAAEEKAHLFDLMNQPADPHRIARLARTPEEGAELYLASVLAIEPDHWAEQAYLNTLRDALALSPDLARELEASAAGSRTA